jgi:hypothetical protein
MKRLLLITMALAGLAACGSAAAKAPEATQASPAPTTAAPVVTEAPTTAAPTTEAPTTTAKPECVNGAADNRNNDGVQYDHWVCRDGHWSFDKTVVIPTTTVAPPTTEAPTTTEAPAPVYADITSRDWKLIAKAPKDHAGETIMLYGRVTQFDSATSGATPIFRANVDGEKQAKSYDYDTNTLISAVKDPSILDEVVEGDLFVATATVISEYSYETTMGGTLTVPLLDISSITVYGSAD